MNIIVAITPTNLLRATKFGLATLSCLGLAACGSAGNNGEATASPTPTVPPVILKSNFTSDTKVAVDKLVKLSVTQGKLRKVSLTAGDGGVIPGNRVKNSWQATERLDPGKIYSLKASVVDSVGDDQVKQLKFRTVDLTKDEEAYPSVSPLAGQTVGVGMPIMIHFDRPIANKANFEKHMTVTSSVGQKGSFYWLDSQNVHYRPKSYWQAGSDITVGLDLNGISAGNGIFGQLDRTIKFHVGSAVVMKVDARTHQMRVYQNGALLRSLPITTGKPGQETRSGTKVIIEKIPSKTMNSETVGIDPEGPDGYNIEDVKYTQRLTFSGEFIHAAPWSVGSQGRANVSHGCTGMSTANAGWLYSITKIGDPVEYSGTNRYMTLTNGYGDWNISWDDWVAGSALN